MSNLPQQQTIVQYLISNTGQTQYTFAFYAPLETDITVYYQLPTQTPNPVQDLLVLNDDYTVTYNNDPTTGGYITLLKTLTLNSILTINRQVQASLDVDFTQAQNFNGANLDAALDRLLLLCQQNQNYNLYRNLSYIINSYLPNATPYTQLPTLPSGYVWVGGPTGVTAAQLAPDDSTTLRSELANNQPFTDGANLVGFYNGNDQSNTSVDGMLNQINIYGVDSGVVNALSFTNSNVTILLHKGLTANVLVAHTNTGAATLNINGTGAIAIYRDTNTPIIAGDLVANITANFVYDGTHYILKNPAQAFYAADTSGAANTITAAMYPNLYSYLPNGPVYFVKIAHTNTGATTINLNSIGSLNVTLADGSSLIGNELIAGKIYQFFYDGTNMQVLNPSVGYSTGTNYILKLPGGFMLQMGTIGALAPNSSQAVTFASAFSTTLLTTQCTTIYEASGGNANVAISAASLTGLTINNVSGTAGIGGAYWLAIGF